MALKIKRFNWLGFSQSIVVLSLSLLLCFWPLSVFAQPNTDFEQRVLETIRQHPEVILESVQAYQQRQQQQAQETQQALAQDLVTHPEMIVGLSPSTSPLENRAVLLEFSDFQCPYCAEAHETVQAFVARHPEQVTLVYKHFPLNSIHPQALAAAKAAYAAQRQDQFWTYHDALFEHQDQLGEDFYLKTARILNLNLEQFNRDRAQAMGMIQQDIDLGAKLGIRGTPFFFFQGQIFSGAVPAEKFEELL